MTGQLWQGFDGLNTELAKQRAEITAVDTGSVTVRFLGGNVATFSTTTSYTVGQKVYVLGNEIKGIAPDLAYFTADV